MGVCKSLWLRKFSTHLLGYSPLTSWIGQEVFVLYYTWKPKILHLVRNRWVCYQFFSRSKNRTAVSFIGFLLTYDFIYSLTLRRLMPYMEHPFLMFLDHTQRRSTVGKTPLDEWSARRTDLYLTTHDTHNRQISMPPLGFEPTIAAGERPLADKISIFHTVPGMSGAMEHVSVRNLSHALSKNC